SRSASTPPTGAAKIGGTRRRISTRATAVWFPFVISKASAMNASVATQSPRPETACPANRRRNPRTANRPRTPPWRSVGIREQSYERGRSGPREGRELVAVVTDSAANVPLDLAAELGVTVVPL